VNRYPGLGGGPDDFTPAALVDAKRWFLTAFEVGDTLLFISYLFNGYRLVIATSTQPTFMVSTLAL
jgi:hypothetical protein